MPRRHPPTHATDAAIERRLDALRQIPAKVEAAEFMARKFQEACRPLSEDGGEPWAADERPTAFRPMPPEPLIDPYPREFKIAFLRGAAVSAAIAVALWWLGVI